MSRKRIVFCGVGALGSGALVLARNLDADLVAIDFDRVESKNLLAQAYVKPSVGKNKADAMKLQMQNFWGVKIEAFGVRVTAENVEALCGKADLVVDCFDNRASREVLSTFARARRRARARGRVGRRDLRSRALGRALRAGRRGSRRPGDVRGRPPPAAPRRAGGHARAHHPGPPRVG